MRYYCSKPIISHFYNQNMKNSFFFFFLLFLSYTAQSQTKALTEDGREVVLYNNGTWRYQQEQDSTAVNTAKVDSLPLNKKKFTRPAGSSFLVKSKAFNIGIYINPSKWTFAPRKDNEKNPEFRFALKSDDAYAMTVAESTTIDLDNIRDIALLNAQKVSLDVKETFAEYRMVNGLKVLCLQFKGTIKGIKFVYYGYYYSNANGTIQMIGYTSQQKFESLKSEIENFLNGLVEIN